mmetsp:Transcript_4360/g.13188  ORF Transcript_4360/g.13188 Transcript_4360/m.13188 type:complete len:388 (+) Transcript_4360:310-1473(+)|eukprot:CAMPEP_0198734080 /NCGR_PEP_ID=MMETSP1475-20131203/50338_1 /TAXON_ID= ORGANISM="Unidentified sp., Strain CCMP1999" /NCGR_SAMPLE_ID=MMETSP1475 /ASSEMBLY_ACC=CAM_ASM_001111 /LENGTH=387 /DNA_ID=CAMNT_0044497487 /DNA_START=246 /DNA_END=1409 /DNA_ORIENTATION=+
MGSDSLIKNASQQTRMRAVFCCVSLAAVLLSGFGSYQLGKGARRGVSEEDIAELKLKLQQAEEHAEITLTERLHAEKKLNQMEKEVEMEKLAGEQFKTQAAMDNPGWVEKGKGDTFALCTAYIGDKYDIMGALSSDTKAKYAAYHKYAYFLDNELLNNKMSFQQRSGSRIQSFRRHWNDYDWLVWTDADVLITNPEISFADIVKQYAPEGSGKHVIMSRDWGGRQVNPGVTFLRTSPEGKAFLDRWEKEIALAQHNDDLLAIKHGMQRDRPAEELKYLQFVPQHVLNSYPKDELKFENFNQKTVEHHSSHEFWEPGHLFVHVVNCLRQSPYKLDAACCDGIAARYWFEFMKRLKDLLLSDAQISEAEVDAKAFEDWTVKFKASLCLN